MIARGLPAALVAVVACSGPRADAPASAPPLATSPGIPFSSMSDAQKRVHMKTVIRPEMGKLFQAFDPVKYADFGCKTCHGPNDEDTHDFLPKIHLSGGGHAALEAAKPALTKFMVEVVAPKMADEMNEKHFDFATRTGFGCGGCHRLG